MTYETLLNEVRSLPPNERAALMNEIMATFVPLPDAEHDRELMEKIEARIDALENGSAKTVSYEDVLEFMRSRRFKRKAQ